jgi:hypothetical protein
VEDARCDSNRVDDPKLADAEAGIERRLAADVVAKRGIRDLDDEEDVFRLSPVTPLARG